MPCYLVGDLACHRMAGMSLAGTVCIRVHLLGVSRMPCACRWHTPRCVSHISCIPCIACDTQVVTLTRVHHARDTPLAGGV